MEVCCADDLMKHLRKAPKPSSALQESFVMTDPRKRSQGARGDCTVLALSIVTGYSYETLGRLLDPLVVSAENPGEIGIKGGDYLEVLKGFGFYPVFFTFPVTLLELWDLGFFEIQKRARRAGIICTKNNRGGHISAFVTGKIFSDYLPDREGVRAVFLKQQNDLGNAV